MKGNKLVSHLSIQSRSQLESGSQLESVSQLFHLVVGCLASHLL